MTPIEKIKQRSLNVPQDSMEPQPDASFSLTSSSALQHLDVTFLRADIHDAGMEIMLASFD
jgi:hypothetical protein